MYDPTGETTNENVCPDCDEEWESCECEPKCVRCADTGLKIEGLSHNYRTVICHCAAGEKRRNE